MERQGTSIRGGNTSVEESKGACFSAADVLRQSRPMDESAHITAEGQREKGRFFLKKPEEAVRTPCCLLTLCNPLHLSVVFPQTL